MCTQKSVYLRLEGLKDTSKCSHHYHLVHCKPIKCLCGYICLDLLRMPKICISTNTKHYNLRYDMNIYLHLTLLFS